MLDAIPITQTLPAITCDYQSLREWAEGITAKYRDLTITEDQVKEIKSDMAELNKAKQKLERARIDTVKEISAPIRKFEAEIKAISRMFDDVYGALANQVKVFEGAEKDKKRDQIQAMIAVECSQANVDSDVIPFNPRWLNKTVSKEVIRKDVKAQILAHKEAQNIRLLAYPTQRNSLPTNQEITPEKANSGAYDIASASIAQMEEKIAQDKRDNPRTVWHMVFSYRPEEAEVVRQIFQECQFMRIVRRLDGIGIKAEIFKEDR